MNKKTQCDGFGNCQNMPIFTLTSINSNKKEHWCAECLKKAQDGDYILIVRDSQC